MNTRSSTTMRSPSLMPQMEHESVCAPHSASSKSVTSAIALTELVRTSGLGFEPDSLRPSGACSTSAILRQPRARVDSFGSWRGALRSALCRALRSRAAPPVADELQAGPPRRHAREAKERSIRRCSPSRVTASPAERGFDTLAGGCRTNCPDRPVHPVGVRSSSHSLRRRKEWLVAFNFLACDRDQEFLLPPSLREWLPEDHLAWFVTDAVTSIDLSGFYVSYREDGWGRAAFDPQMMVALLLYAYAVGERSSRGIERRCREDVAFRVITANQVPDHATIARFRARHEQALADTFVQVLALCAQAGLVSVGVVALDGSLLAGNASPAATRSHSTIREEVEQMLAEAARADAEEDGRLGAARGA